MQYFPWNTPPPVNVTLQQPPTLSAWKAAVIGAVSAFVMNLILEFLKPKLERRRTLAMIDRHLALELFRAMHLLEIGIDAMKHASQDPDGPEALTALAISSIKSIRHRRLDGFVAAKLDIVNEIDSDEQLPLFYEHTELVPKLMLKWDLQSCLDWAIEGATVGQSYMIRRKIHQRFAANRSYRLYKEYADKRGVDWSSDPMKPTKELA